MPSYRPRSVWGPFSTIVNVLTFGVGVGLFLAAIILPLSLLSGGGASFHTEREGQLCARAGAMPVEGVPTKGDYTEQIGTIEHGVSVVPTELLVCEPKKGLDHKAVKYTLKVLTSAPTYAVYFVFLFGIRRVMTQTDRGGPFGHDTARLVVRLGWWLFGGLIAATLLESSAESLLLGTMVKDQTWGWAVEPDFPAVMILGALGIVGVGRVLKQGAQLQDDVEGTV
ncbi:MAG: hypothetical protein QOH68_2020 [Nocardioidaceae bacterium]|nr:hypothetical protein [Nocardioidaceae bacterium]